MSVFFATLTQEYRTRVTVQLQVARGGAGQSRRAPDAITVPTHFGDIWCLFVSFGPAPHIYQRGERVGGPVCTIFTATIRATWLSVRQGREVPGTGPTLAAYT